MGDQDKNDKKDKNKKNNDSSPGYVKLKFFLIKILNEKND